jgi:hypothetical protein
MRTIAFLVVVLVGASFMLATGCSNAANRKSAKPGFMERIKKDSITGEVTDVGRRYVAVRQDNGETVKVRVDDRTKMDVVQPGDRVKAYTDDAGYASTLQRLASK